MSWSRTVFPHSVGAVQKGSASLCKFFRFAPRFAEDGRLRSTAAAGAEVIEGLRLLYFERAPVGFGSQRRVRDRLHELVYRAMGYQYADEVPVRIFADANRVAFVHVIGVLLGFVYRARGKRPLKTLVDAQNTALVTAVERVRSQVTAGRGLEPAACQLKSRGTEVPQVARHLVPEVGVRNVSGAS